MMQELFSAYLTTLDGVSSDLDHLADLCRAQSDAVRKDDLNHLNEVMKQQQVVGLSLRGREQKRQKQALQLGLDGSRLSTLPQSVPKELLPRAQETVEHLRRSYENYSNAAQAARTTLEINLHEINKILTAHGVDPAQAASYAPDASAAQPPSNMKTDFRA